LDSYLLSKEALQYLNQLSTYTFCPIILCRQLFINKAVPFFPKKYKKKNPYNLDRGGIGVWAWTKYLPPNEDPIGTILRQDLEHQVTHLLHQEGGRGGHAQQGIPLGGRDRPPTGSWSQKAVKVASLGRLKG
jgi:hypothetical protein